MHPLVLSIVHLQCASLQNVIIIIKCILNVRPSSSLIVNTFLSIYTEKQKHKKSLRILSKLRGFSNFIKIEFWWRQVFQIFMVLKPSQGSCEVPYKIGPDRFCRFDVFRIQTYRQTPRQAEYIYIMLRLNFVYKYFFGVPGLYYFIK